MKRIRKSELEPPALTAYKDRFQHAPTQQTWAKFKTQALRRNNIKDQLRHDQRGLCCYCENTLLPDDESVEHFIARNVDHNLELEWSNFLLCCLGGERPLSEEIADGASRYEPGGTKTCGHAKLASSAIILNPLAIPAFPRLFCVRSESSEIIADEDKCNEAGIDPLLVSDTIEKLGLQTGRLNRARQAIMETLTLQLTEDAADAPFSVDRERRLAAEQIPKAGVLPGFFTTIRFFLGDGGEEYLQSIQYQG